MVDSFCLKEPVVRKYIMANTQLATMKVLENIFQSHNVCMGIMHPLVFLMIPLEEKVNFKETGQSIEVFVLWYWRRFLIILWVAKKKKRNGL